jgi:asparagine synthase (glutamine-hydrolysing)
MSVCGFWSTTRDPEPLVRAMLGSFAHCSWPVRVVSDEAAPFAVAWAPAEADAAAHPSGVVVAGDLRLHNRLELASALGADQHATARWLVAEAYVRWGADFPARLRGDFGLALWDARARRLLLSRDTGGACSIFYSTRQGRLAFASHPRGILALPEFPRTLESRAVVDYLAELPQHEGSTLFASISRLPPGSSLLVDERSVGLASYFDIEAVGERRLESDREYADALRAALAEAVECRLPESRKLAVMLSGGLDSSTITLLASVAPPERRPSLTTISGIFPGFPECDERGYQADVVRASGAEHCEIRPDPAGSSGDFSRLCRVFSEPAFIGPHWLAWDAAEVAARSGATAMMTGIDGDRVISHGAGRIGDLATARDWTGLGRELLAVSDYTWGRRLRVGAVQASLALLPPRVRAALEARDPRRGRQIHLLSSLLRADVLERHDVRERLRALPLRARSTRAEHARILTAADRNWDVELLEQLGTAFNLRFEQPFFDRRVVELCFSFPGSQKRRGGLSRFVLRNAMRGLLPASVVERRADASFDRPYWAWARAWLGANRRAGDSTRGLEAYVNMREVERRLGALPEEPADGPVDFLWRCVILSRWLEETGAR